MSQFILKLLRKEKASRLDCYSFYFQRPDDFEFLPGQYLKWTIKKELSDERGNSRFFTISSSPTEKDHLLLTTRIIQSEFKKELLKMNIGETITATGPFGKFVLDEKDVSPRVFIAGGIGITPFRSMAVFTRDKKLRILLTLFVSFSTVEEMVYYDELKSIADFMPSFKFVPTVTKPEQSKLLWSGETGRIDDEKLRRFIPNILLPTYYIVGPTKMVDGTRELVLKMGIKDEKILIENFPGY